MDDPKQADASTGQTSEGFLANVSNTYKGDAASIAGRAILATPKFDVPPDFMLLLADVWTKLWRVRKAIAKDEADRQTLAAYDKRLGDILDTIGELGFVIRDHTGEKFLNGMSLRVLLFQPHEGVAVETISETISPSVFYNNQLVRMGEVIVDMPPSLSPKKGGSA
jgi:hypothetical protein